MTYYDPYVSVEQGRPSFHAEDLYELNRRSQTISASGGPSVPPGLASLHRESSHSDHSYPEVLSPRKPSHRKRLTKTRPRPASLAVGNPRTLAAPTTFSSASSASSAPGSAQMLFHVPPSVNAFSPAYGGHVHRISSTDFAQERVSSYSLGQDDYSLPPSANDTAFLIDKDAKRWPDASASAALPPGKRPLSLTPRARAPQRKGMFERPPWGLIALHCMLCCVAWPTINYMSPLVRASLFWTRAYVGVLCSAFGIPIAFSLLELVRRWSEAAAWATVIHRSEAAGEGGIRMRDIADMTADSTSAWVASKILWARLSSHDLSRSARKTYDKRPWSIFITFFLVVILYQASLTFILGRIVNIETAVVHQFTNYREIVVPGDLSQADITRASFQGSAFQDYVRTWTLAPFASSDSQASVISFRWQNDDIYFAEATDLQLAPGGRGKGTFELNTTDAQMERRELARRDALDATTGTSGTVAGEPTLGQVLRYPKWGIRIHCETLPDPQLNLVPSSNSGLSYVFLPKTFIGGLYNSFDMDMPELFENLFNRSLILAANDSLPEGLDPSTVAAGRMFSNNGVAHSLWSLPVNTGGKGTGWTQLETVLVRLNETWTPNGVFPLYASPPMLDTATGRRIQANGSVGYDAAVCLEKYEPWVLDTMNGTALPAALRIAGPGRAAADVPAPLAVRQGRTVAVGQRGDGEQEVSIALNSTGKFAAFVVAHDNSVNQIIKDNGRDYWYVPSPTVVSFTSGAGPEGYTTLNATMFGTARARADAANVLPYLAGRGGLVARAFPDRTVAWARVGSVQLAVVLGVALVLGVIAGLCVPRLPRGVPRRDMSMWGWVAVLTADGLLDETHGRGAGVVDRHSEVEEVEKVFGGEKVRYTSLM